jgi:L-ascorbate metabolism protein UlaG (beta-lactamase superfamily)
MELMLLRHATLLLTLGELRFLVDPMLAEAGSMEPIADTPNPRPNPLVDLPLAAEPLRQLLSGLDGVLVTHRHRDHWDDRAAGLLSRDLPIFCQPQDAELLRGEGFRLVYPVEASLIWHGVQITRTEGRHGHGDMARRLGPVSGFLLRAVGEPSVYIAGDTVWCSAVKEVLRHRKPEVVVLNAGAAQFKQGGAITMDLADVIQVQQAAPAAHLVLVHMESMNHCLLTRQQLRDGLRSAIGAGRFAIPADGEALKLRSGHLEGSHLEARHTEQRRQP